MKMTFLGTGGAFTRASENYHNNVLIETDTGELWLIDCGSTALQSLHELGVDPLDIDGVIITHIHADHTGGLEELGFRGLFLGPNKRFKLICPEDLLPSYSSDYTDVSLPDLWKNSLKAGMMHIQDERGYAEEADLETYFDPTPVVVNKSRFSFGTPAFTLGDSDVGCSFMKTAHVPEKVSMGLHIRSESGTKIYFSADSTGSYLYSNCFEQFDLVFHDCMFMPKYPSTVHTHFEELSEFDQKTREKIYLMHYGDPSGAPEDLLGMRLAERHKTYEV